MNRIPTEERLDALLRGVFNAESDVPPPLGFTGRVMAHVADRQTGTAFSRMWWRVARPLLVSGWAMAALLAVLAVSGGGQVHARGVDWLVTGGSLLNYFTL